MPYTKALREGAISYCRAELPGKDISGRDVQQGNLRSPDTYINTSTEDVTRVSDQLYVKAMMMAANINAVNCSIIPSFSDMPICRVLAVFVNVFEAWPLGRVSRVDTGSENNAYKIN